MSEIEQEVKTFSLHYICDECGIGEMEDTGKALLSYPPQYPHTCSKCGHKQTFFRRYPALTKRQIA